MASTTKAVPRPTLGLPVDKAKSVYSLSYLDACCSQAGVGLTPTPQDKDTIAIDATVEFIEQPVRVQLKCTSSPRRTRAGFTVPLEQGWIDLWSTFVVPPYVVLVVVPKVQTGWISHSTDETTHHTAAYWQRFDPHSTKHSIQLPIANRLTHNTIRQWHQDTLNLYGSGVR